jgi:hypothetical protein
MCSASRSTAVRSLRKYAAQQLLGLAIAERLVGGIPYELLHRLGPFLNR